MNAPGEGHEYLEWIFGGPVPPAGIGVGPEVDDFPTQQRVDALQQALKRPVGAGWHPDGHLICWWRPEGGGPVALIACCPDDIERVIAGFRAGPA